MAFNPATTDLEIRITQDNNRVRFNIFDTTGGGSVMLTAAQGGNIPQPVGLQFDRVGVLYIGGSENAQGGGVLKQGLYAFFLEQGSNTFYPARIGTVTSEPTPFITSAGPYNLQLSSFDRTQVTNFTGTIAEVGLYRCSQYLWDVNTGVISIVLFGTINGHNSLRAAADPLNEYNHCHFMFRSRDNSFTSYNGNPYGEYPLNNGINGGFWISGRFPTFLNNGCLTGYATLCNGKVLDQPNNDANRRSSTAVELINGSNIRQSNYEAAVSLEISDLSAENWVLTEPENLQARVGISNTSSPNVFEFRIVRQIGTVNATVFYPRFDQPRGRNEIEFFHLNPTAIANEPLVSNPPQQGSVGLHSQLFMFPEVGRLWWARQNPPDPTAVTYAPIQTARRDQTFVPGDTEPYQMGICCVAGSTAVRTERGIRSISELCPGDRVLDTTTNQFVPLQNIVRFAQATPYFIKVPRGALAPQMPSADLLIQDGHPLLIDGKEVLPEELVARGMASRECLAEPEYVYTMITHKRTFVEVSGAPVATWSAVGWKNFIEKDERAKSLRWKYVEQSQ